MGCTPGGVGDPCTPEDEYQQTFSGFQQTEVNVESRSFQCATRICLVNHFQGRVSCRLGQEAPLDAATGMPTGASYAPACSIPGTKPSTTQTDENNINVKVPAQLVERQTEKAVYCSCRCNGPDKSARYCECPDGFECSKLVDDLKIPGSTGGNLAGSYCIRAGTAYQGKGNTSAITCADKPDQCGCAGDKPADECGAPATMAKQ
jgi:hypothetical protein